MAAHEDSRGVLIELRASREQKRLLAAAVLPVAEEIVARNESIVLTEPDRIRILRLLEQRPKPMPALRAAAKRWRLSPLR